MHCLTGISVNYSPFESVGSSNRSPLMIVAMNLLYPFFFLQEKANDYSIDLLIIVCGVYRSLLFCKYSFKFNGIFSDRLQNQSQNTANCNAATVILATDDVLSEVASRASKSSGSAKSFFIFCFSWLLFPYRNNLLDLDVIVFFFFCYHFTLIFWQGNTCMFIYSNYSCSKQWWTWWESKGTSCSAERAFQSYIWECWFRKGDFYYSRSDISFLWGWFSPPLSGGPISCTSKESQYAG